MCRASYTISGGERMSLPDCISRKMAVITSLMVNDAPLCCIIRGVGRGGKNKEPISLSANIAAAMSGTRNHEMVRLV